MTRWAMILVLLTAAGVRAEGVEPRVFLLDARALAENRERAMSDDPTLDPVLRRLVAQADGRLDDGPFSVMDKTSAPPSGDKHDYQSMGPYWWPDPDSQDGLPYIRRDGRVNPEYRSRGDVTRFKQMQSAVITLARAWYFTGQEHYAARAAELLRAWYIDPATRMNPNLEYAQGIPGRAEGRCFGIVDAANQPHLVDAIGLLENSQAWTDADQRAMVRWFEQFLDWLLTSDHGQTEDATKNNHATQYDVQVATYALFVGRTDIAERVLRAVGPRRIDTHIQPDGSQPHELTRTKSWNYCCFNASSLVRLAILGEHVGVDLWHYDATGVTIGHAIDYLVPYVSAPRDWPHRQISPLEPGKLLTPLLYAAGQDDKGEYTKLIRKMLNENDVRRLLYRVP